MEALPQNRRALLFALILVLAAYCLVFGGVVGAALERSALPVAEPHQAEKAGAIA